MTRLKVATALTATAFCVLGCSKAVVKMDRQNPPQETVQMVQSQPVQQTAAERIAEIDRLLAAPLKGTPEDSDRRVALRAERNALLGNHAASQFYEQTQRASADAQASREHQQMIDRMKGDAERSKIAEQRQLQAQRDQWDKESRLSLRRINGDFRPEAPPQNVYDIQVRSQRSRVVQPVYP